MLAAASGGIICLWDEATQRLTPCAWKGAWEPGASWRADTGGVIGVVALQHRGLLVNDYPHVPYAVPPFAQRYRVVALSTTHPAGRFTEQDRDLLALLATQAALAIENARLFDEGAQRQIWLTKILEINKRMATHAVTPSLFAAIAEESA